MESNYKPFNFCSVSYNIQEDCEAKLGFALAPLPWVLQTLYLSASELQVEVE